MMLQDITNQESKPEDSTKPNLHVQSAPATPCDDAAILIWSDKAFFETATEGVWWWRRPLGVRRTQCRRCGASSSTRPLRMIPCAGVAKEEYDWGDRRPLMSKDRPLLFTK
ncbi:hypothetical protein JYU34_016763 [Plutella xylostella]|uniref:Uncharacterized protein n=1 Tax=Plutella xylostella TaxID=51655 RepID=A0ABQ7Q3E7_PLUXY|nr:hypothetical protein JYU34_016763 [Plutella xylostella]